MSNLQGRTLSRQQWNLQMSKIVVIDRSGAEEALEIRSSLTLMQTITDAGISDLLALCGGVCSCATCHVYIDGEKAALIPSMSEDENGLLDGTSHRQENSRLSCQIRLTPELDGLRVTIAPED
jgi:2Fe-2S ferredoxin